MFKTHDKRFLRIELVLTQGEAFNGHPMGMPQRLTLRWQGLRDSFQFSNWPSIVWKRLKKEPEVLYRTGCWSLECNTTLGDHYSAKEVLARRVYDTYIRKACRESTCSYVNVGANVGAFDVAVARLGYRIPQALSIELNPHTHLRLLRNLKRNDLGAVRPMNAGIADTRNVLSFTPRVHSLADSIYSQNHETPISGQPVEVPLLPLEDAMETNGFLRNSFDLLKLDCEGAEYAIIRSTPPQILGLFRHIVMELHPPPPGESVDATYDKLTSCGFETHSPRWNPNGPTALRFWSQKG
jgi:FkbM family methyltransferase